MKIRRAGKSGESFVRRVTRHIRAKCDGVKAFGEEIKVCAVGVINEQKHAHLMAYIRNRPDIRNVSEVIGGGDIYCARRMSGDSISDIVGGNPGIRKMRRSGAGYKLNVKVKSCRGVYEGLMYRTCGNNFFILCRSELKHRLYSER